MEINGKRLMEHINTLGKIGIERWQADPAGGQ